MFEEELESGRRRALDFPVAGSVLKSFRPVKVLGCLAQFLWQPFSGGLPILQGLED